MDDRRLPPGWQHLAAADSFGRTVDGYLSLPAAYAATRVVVVFVQGSGSRSVFVQTAGGEIRSGYHGLLRQVAPDFAILAVEKPGVRLYDAPIFPGTAVNAREEFLREHTLSRWTGALRAALKSAVAVLQPGPEIICAVGHSEGGVAAASLASLEKALTHVACIASSGSTQLFDLFEIARQKPSPDFPADSETQRIQALLRDYAYVVAHPDDTSPLIWGHPPARWASFLKASTVDFLIRSRARILLAHGGLDESVPPSSFFGMWAELMRAERHVAVSYFSAADHGIRAAGEHPTEGMKRCFLHIRDWLLRSEANENPCRME